MIKEIWDFISTPTSLRSRFGGFLYYSIAMNYRAQRCSVHWDSHLAQCHAVFTKFLTKNPQARSIAVLGSGLLLETPLDLIPAHIEQIFLVDTVHTKQVRDKIIQHAKAKKIQLIECDLSNDRPNISPDLLVSANLLSQLPLLAKNRKSKTRTQIQAEHLALCKEICPNFLLFSDFKMQAVDQMGIVLQEQKTVELNLDWTETWSWNLAPAPEIANEYSVILQVGCLS